MRRLFPDPAEDVDVEAAYAVPTGTRWLRANMVSTVDGSVTDAERLSGGISGPADKALFASLRTMADAVLVGAGTVRAERYRPAALPIVVVSRRLDLDLTAPLFTEAKHRTVVLTAADARADLLEATAAVADVIATGDGVVDLTAGVAALRERGLNHLICEGGPTLLGALLTERLVDEVCLAVSPMIVGGSAGRIVNGPWLPDEAWRLRQLLETDGFLFARWERP
jgi:riboflavin biosynthesis pyrimidine reductase